MRLTQKKIEELLVDIIGEGGLGMIRELVGKENVSEFDLATKTKSDIKVIRRQLYMLYNHNLVSFTRKKDKQKGWYIYYWTLELDSLRFNYFKNKKQLLERLQNLLEREEKELWFISPDGGIRLNMDDAMKFDFHCPETGELMEQEDNSGRIAGLKKRIKEVAQEVEILTKQRQAKRRVIKEKAKKKVTKKKATVKKKAATKKKSTKKKPASKETAKKASKKKASKKTTSKKATKKSARKAVKKKAATKAKKKKVATRKKVPKKKTPKKTTKNKSAKKKAKK